MANSIATNTLVIPNIPKLFFTSQDAIDTIRSMWEDFGELHQMIPMKGFRRLMVIYLDTQHAIAAKNYMDHRILYWQEIDNTMHIVGLETTSDKDISNDLPLYEMEARVYFGQHNPINPDPASFSLQVPDLGRNLLISPPGDPCNQWEQRAESPPNKAILASDLLRALTTVDEQGDEDDLDMLDDFQLDDGPITKMPSTDTDTDDIPAMQVVSSPLSSTSSSPRLETPTLQLSFDHDSLPTIRIQDMDGSLLTQHHQKTNRPSATARPPIRS
ncbi:Calcipressin-domain-containing protein [Halteromyces radiatus]|uniref:Calcipressin-domain-containing protein n=1 Tax=Halteromyces radiatus TaxID=101107 RepID=UPI00221FB244|nr:Calcipressin-domain-containing protein [Halteromyces radiatus]KAI8098586.1 Calcipressin-domain-containing protein [Halteromyces radiatus]